MRCGRVLHNHLCEEKHMIVWKDSTHTQIRKDIVSHFKADFTMWTHTQKKNNHIWEKNIKKGNNVRFLCVAQEHNTCTNTHTTCMRMYNQKIVRICAFESYLCRHVYVLNKCFIYATRKYQDRLFRQKLVGIQYMRYGDDTTHTRHSEKTL